MSIEAAAAFGRELRFAMRGLLRARWLTVTVVITLALGIGANAAIFSVVRGVLLRPLVNRDEDRLIYIRQSATGLSENLTFSMAEINDIKSRVTTISTFGDFSTTGSTAQGSFGSNERKHTARRGTQAQAAYFANRVRHPLVSECPEGETLFSDEMFRIHCVLIVRDHAVAAL